MPALYQTLVIVKNYLKNAYGQVLQSIYLGKSGSAGDLRIYPGTASKGYLKLLGTANTGDTVTTLTNAAMGQASVISIPDPGGATGTVALLEKAQSFTAAQTFGGASAHAVTTADKLTVGGVIVPVEDYITIPIGLHATKTIFNLFTARVACQITAIDYVPDIAQGGALTGVVSKVTSTSTPASATTPMHTGTINLNGTAHTVQGLTLTATGADLVLAAGDRIGFIESAAMTVGSGLITIKMKRV